MFQIEDLVAANTGRFDVDGLTVVSLGMVCGDGACHVACWCSVSGALLFLTEDLDRDWIRVCITIFAIMFSDLTFRFLLIISPQGTINSPRLPAGDPILQVIELIGP